MMPFERLISLALAELPEAEMLAAEDHVLGCSECARSLEELLELRDGVVVVTRAGAVPFLASRALVERLDREGRVTRRYEMAPGGAVACTVDSRDVYALACLTLDPRGVERLDLSLEAPSGSLRLRDVPFDRQRGELLFLQAATTLRTQPTQREIVRLFGVGPDGERLLGEYVFNHTAYDPSRPPG